MPGFDVISSRDERLQLMPLFVFEIGKQRNAKVSQSLPFEGGLHPNRLANIERVIVVEAGNKHLYCASDLHVVSS